MELQIKPNQLRIAVFQSIRIACGLEPLESGMVQRALRNSTLTLTAELDGEAVGMLRVAGDGSFIFVIADVMVLPAHRNRGIASTLLLRALDEIRAMLPGGCSAMVNLISATGKENLYKRAGFYQTPYGAIPAQMVAIVNNPNRL